MQCQRQPNTANAYLTGCLDRAVQSISAQAEVLGGVGVGIAFVMVKKTDLLVKCFIDF